MNSNYRNADIGRYESKGAHTGYPVPTNPIQKFDTSHMSNMRYEDWQDMCGTKKEGELFSYATGVQAANDITWAILHIENPAFSEAGGIYNKITPILWPTETKGSQAVWSSLMDRGEYLLGKPIDSIVKSQVLVEIESFDALFYYYNNILTALKQNPGETAIQESVRT
ncbi:TPA: hypothetical protein QCS32_006316, partial [Bacillus thuringiensis]|nr:hypothetical protein [Bacillus thuringiensis]